MTPWSVSLTSIAATALLMTVTGAAPGAAQHAAATVTTAATGGPATVAAADSVAPVNATEPSSSTAPGDRTPERQQGVRASRNRARAKVSEQARNQRAQTQRERAKRVQAERDQAERQQAVRAARAERARAKERDRVRSWVLPLNAGHFSSGFGYRWGRLHAGDDFAVAVGTPVHAMSSGTVVALTRTGVSGLRVEIRYWDGTVSHYYHLSRAATVVGKQVEPGELVAYSGNTGRSTGPHLHLEIHPGGGPAVDPWPWLIRHGLA